jgi:hypothetical protein
MIPKIKKMSKQDRLDMILDDLESMIESYGMNPGESAAILLNQAAGESMDGCIDADTFLKWAAEAWECVTVQRVKRQIAEVRNVQNNGLFKS